MSLRRDLEEARRRREERFVGWLQRGEALNYTEGMKVARKKFPDVVIMRLRRLPGEPRAYGKFEVYARSRRR